jgi:isocitrate/isopropylmalate dehydrogenase
MLDHLGEGEPAVRLQGAIERVYAEGRCRTRDLGGTATTSEFTDAVVTALARGETQYAQRQRDAPTV